MFLAGFSLARFDDRGVPQGMMGRSPVSSTSVRRARAELVERLRLRSPELEEAVLARVLTLSAPASGQDPEYIKGLRETVTETISYALKAIEDGEAWSEPVPLAAVGQARRAARHGVSLDTVLRRYAAGDRTFAMYVVDEAEDLPRDLRQEIQRTHSVPIDRLMATVASEYEGELARVRQSPTHQLQRRIRRLLAGDLDSDCELSYRFGGWHVGLITSDSQAGVWGKVIASRLDCQLLFVGALEDGAWLWLGRNRKLLVEEVEEALKMAKVDLRVPLVLGEARLGLDGWRQTHAEALAALRTVVVPSPRITRCRDVALVAAVMKDPALTRSLVSSYLSPLDSESTTSGAKFRKTLRAYFTKGQNMSAAASLLGLERRTVRSHLEEIEALLGRPVTDCHAELQVALEVEKTVEAQRSREAAVGLDTGAAKE